MNKKILSIILVSVISISMIGILGSCSKKNDSDSSSTTNGDATPAYNFKLKDQHGKIHKLSAYKGKVVLVSFWATWCSACRQELPVIEKLSEKYSKKDVTILSCTVPGQNNELNPEKMTGFLNNNSISHPVLFDSSGKVWEKYNIRSIPTIYVINKKGEISTNIAGATDEKSLEDLIKKASKE